MAQEKIALLISIKPRYADMIFQGTKTVELRRKEPRVSKGDDMMIYVSSPRMQLTGSARITEIETGTPNQLWLRVSHKTGLSKKEFDLYFEGTDMAVAIHIEDPHVFKKPVGLQTLRSRMGIVPPQSFRYVAHKTFQAA
jgi:predicted transcriptional regulator